MYDALLQKILATQNSAHEDVISGGISLGKDSNCAGTTKRS